MNLVHHPRNNAKQGRTQKVDNVHKIAIPTHFNNCR